jgi:hypothetical protein
MNLHRNRSVARWAGTIRPILATLAFVVALSSRNPTPAHAAPKESPQTGTISGRVLDEHDVRIPHAVAIILGMSMGAYADSTGMFTIKDVPVGTYTLRAREVGFSHSIKAGVRVEADQTTYLVFRLKRAPVPTTSGPSREIVSSCSFGLPMASAGHQNASSVHSFISESHITGIPYERAHSLGPSALPALYEMLRDVQSKPDWWKVVLTVGNIGVPASYDSLADFMWTRFRGPVDFETFRAQTSTLYGIGSLTPSQESVAYLIKGTNPEVWRRLPWTFVVPGESEWFGVTLGMSSIAGLGLTGTERADSALKALEAKPYAPGQVRSIKEALKRNAAIRKRGRLAYEREAKKGQVRP